VSNNCVTTAAERPRSAARGQRAIHTAGRRREAAASLGSACL